MTELLGDRIRAARERYGMSQSELARRIKVSKQTMYQIESNKTPDPGALKVKAIADVLRVSTDYLLGREAEPDAPSSPAPPPQPKRQRTRKAAPVAACAETAMAPGTTHP